MQRQILRVFTVSVSLLSLFSALAAVLTPATGLSQQVQTGIRFPATRVRAKQEPAARHAARQPIGQIGVDATAESAAAPVYHFTLIAYPGTLNTLGVGINPGAFKWGLEGSAIDVVGAYVFADGSNQTGFSSRIEATKSFVGESYRELNDSTAPVPQQAYSINDFGQVVGDYIDDSGIFHSYEWDCGQFKPIDVPFAGAAGTYSPAINNSGEIVGGWYDSAGNEHSYTLIGGVFKSFDFPGVTQGQFYYAINSEGAITGSYADASGTIHGFLKRGTDYTSIDYPGANYTATTGINDAGELVGGYCLTTACLNTGEGELGFVLKDGTYTSFTIPGEPIVALESVNNDGVLMGNYLDAAGLIYTFLATAQK